MNAWLLTWEGTAGAAIRPEEKIIAILSPRLSTPVGLVQTIYHRSVDTAYGMCLTANKSKVRAQRYENIQSTSSRYFYGANPCIFARKVTDFQCIKMTYMAVKLSGGWSQPSSSIQISEAGSKSNGRQSNANTLVRSFHWPAIRIDAARPNPSIERTSCIKPREAVHFRRWASQPPLLSPEANHE